MSQGSGYALYAMFALGAVALYYLLPALHTRRTTIGILIGAAALVGFLGLIAAQDKTGSQPFFYVLATVSLLGGVRVITHPKPVYSAIYFVLVVVAVAGLLVLQSAEFLAVALIIIYAGAILVTYLFVIMLAQQPAATLYDQSAREPLAGALAGFIVVAMIAGRAGLQPQARQLTPHARQTADVLVTDAAEQPGNTVSLAATLLTRHVVVLELAGILLLVSMVGAIGLSRKRVPAENPEPAPSLGQIGKEVEPF